MVNLTVNGKKVEAKEGTTLLDAISTVGVEVPSLCHHPDLTPHGGCRLCSVEVSLAGRSWVTTACNYAVEDGIEVQTDSPRAVATRRMMGELLLARCPEVPAIQRMAASLGIDEPRFSTDTPEEDCILCGRCIRACHEIAAKDVLGFVDRGPDRQVTMAYGTYNTVCDDCNKCIPYCPTGAITRLKDLPIGRRWYEAARRWIRTRQAVQYGALALFVFLFFTSDQKWWPFNVVNLFSRLDPLQAITASVAARGPILLFWPALLTIAATVVFGRVWCAWACPLGAILELFGPRGTRSVGTIWRQVKYVALFAIVIMAAFGSLAFMFFDPITILVRGLAEPISTVLGLIKSTNRTYLSLIAVIPLAVVVGLNRIEKRFWCRYLCPLGALVGLGSKVSWIRRRVNETSCVKCGDCVKVCPMGAINPDTIRHDPAECIMCMDCAAPCPETVITFGQQPMPRWHHEFDPGRRELIGAGATAAAGLVLFNTSVAKAQSPDIVRPPGVAAKEKAFLAECIRCGQCVEACATHALHPVALGMSWEGFWTPALMPSLGYCHVECNRCGQVCPSGAIPALSLPVKSKQVMGLAVVDEPLCINCMVCRKACRLKAIDEVEIRKAGKNKPLPKVLPNLCTGCGECVYVCPAPGAILVRALSETPRPS